MKRINIYEEQPDGYGMVEVFVGWFDKDAAEEIASYQEGSPYISGSVLYATKKGRLVTEDWTNTGYRKFRFAEDKD